MASATPVLVEDLLQVRIQEHSSGVQLLADVTELSKGGVHFLKVLPGAIVGLWKQADAVDFVLTELAGYATGQDPTSPSLMTLLPHLLHTVQTPRQKERGLESKAEGI